MPKKKNITQEEIGKVMEAIESAAFLASEMEARFNGCKCEEILSAFEDGRTSVACARSILSFSSRLFSQHSLQELQRKTKDMIEQHIKEQ